MSKPAVIVVNSHVVRGSVGGRSAVFALERTGFPVWSLATVSLAWHPGHGRATRMVPHDTAFAAMVADLAGSAKLGEAGGILIGYLGSVGQIGPLAELVVALKRCNSAARFLYDPNIGDNGALFQPEELAAAARDELLPLADIATPNRFELGWLSGLPVEEEGEIAAAARRLGPREVVVTSAIATDAEIGMMLLDDGNVAIARHKALAVAPKGTGDLFAALYLGHRFDGRPATEAMQRAASAVGRLVQRAVETGADELPLAGGGDDLGGDPMDVAVFGNR